jgi:hypothetical protein
MDITVATKPIRVLAVLGALVAMAGCDTNYYGSSGATRETTTTTTAAPPPPPVSSTTVTPNPDGSVTTTQHTYRSY